MFALVASGWYSGSIPKDFSCLKNQFVSHTTEPPQHGAWSLTLSRTLCGTTGAFKRHWERTNVSSASNQTSDCASLPERSACSSH